MKNKYDSLLYIDLGELSPEEWTGVWEFDSLTEIKQPTIIRYIPNQTVVQFWQGPIGTRKQNLGKMTSQI